jgi:DNA-binding transcriptional ArsR family regulator
MRYQYAYQPDCHEKAKLSTHGEQLCHVERRPGITQRIPRKTEGFSMVDDTAMSDDQPSPELVLDALDDPDCQSILRETADPMTATELAEACDIPRSTLYRKLEQLSDAALLREHDKINPDGGRTSYYQRNFENVNITIDEDDTFSVTIEHGRQGTDERLRDIWSKMGDEL